MNTTTTPTQKAMIREHLLTYGTLTPLDALDRYGCFRLAARIQELREDGMQIESRPWTTPGGARVAKYIVNLTPGQHEFKF